MKNMRKNYAQQNHMAYFTRSVPPGQIVQTGFTNI